MAHKNAGEILSEMAATYFERNAKYKDNYKRFGLMMTALFPEGLTVKTVDEWNRICIFMMITSKITRYAANFKEGGHQDSTHDAGVYSAMLEELGNDFLYEEVPKREIFVSSDEVRR